MGPLSSWCILIALGIMVVIAAHDFADWMSR